MSARRVDLSIVPIRIDAKEMLCTEQVGARRTGLAGLLKAILILEKGVIPPTYVFSGTVKFIWIIVSP